MNITLVPDFGYVGDLISIHTTGYFGDNLENIVVLFNGIVADIISGTNSTLDVRIPINALSGPIIVYNTTEYSQEVEFTVLNSEDVFNIKVSTTVPSKGAKYNRDFGVSNFTEIVDETSIIQNVYSILLTKPGERLFNPTFGCELYNKVFELFHDEQLQQKEILSLIENSLIEFEPRAELLKEDSSVVFFNNFNSVTIDLKIRIPTGSIKTVTITFKSISGDNV